MKFFKLLILSIFGLFNLISLISSKKANGRKKHPSASTRNYRKVAADPSYNPLPNKWQTGPLNNFGGGHNHNKYRAYSARIADYKNYHDTTNELHARVNQ